MCRRSLLATLLAVQAPHICNKEEGI